MNKQLNITKIQSLQRNKNDVTALVGYKKIVKIIFDQTLDKFKDAYEKKIFAAVYLYKDAEKLKNKDIFRHNLFAFLR